MNVVAALVGVLCLAALIVVHEAGHFLVARLFGMRVKRFSIGFFKPLVEWKPRGSETTYSIGALPLGGYVQVDGISPVDEVDPEDRASYANQPIYAKLAMIVAGPAANFLLAVLLIAILFVAGRRAATSEPIVGSVAPDHPAAAAGLQPEDRLLKVGAVEVSTWDDMAGEIQKSRGKAVVLRIRRGGDARDVEITPDPDTGLIGITPATRLTEPLGPFEALGRAFVIAAATTVGMAASIWQMATRQRTTAGVAGPVGIVSMLGSAVHTGWRALFEILAQLSLSLCLFNFLPIPALDGGRVTFLAVEAVMRRRVNRTIEGYVHAGGLLVVIGLILLVSFRDCQNLL